MKQALTPHITEKTYRLIEATQESGTLYTFKVPLGFSKEHIKAMVEKQHNVTVTDVRTVRIPGKVRRFRNIPGKTSSFKKALVQLKKGNKIAAFDVESTAPQAEDKE